MTDGPPTSSDTPPGAARPVVPLSYMRPPAGPLDLPQPSTTQSRAARFLNRAPDGPFPSRPFPQIDGAGPWKDGVDPNLLGTGSVILE